MSALIRMSNALYDADFFNQGRNAKAMGVNRDYIASLIHKQNSNS
jgi:hypothetical protein